MQETVERTPVRGYAGAIASGFPKAISRRALEPIEFGQAVVEDDGGESIRKPLLNSFAFTWGVAMSASNVFDGSISYRKVGEASFTNVELTAVTYASSAADSAEAVATQLEADLGAALASATVSNSNRTITLLAAEGYELKEGPTPLSITGGTPTTTTIVQGSTDEILGIARHIHKQQNSLDLEDAKWNAGEMVPVVTQGVIWVVSEEAATTKSTPHVRIQDGNGYSRGDIRVSVGSPVVGIPLSGKFRNASDAAGLTKLEVNKP
jgi:hypothetical protein